MAFRELNSLEEAVPRWIKKGFSSKKDLDLIEHFGKYIAGKAGGRGKSISTSQIRIAYGEISRLKMQFDETDMMMLRPKIAYAAAREGGEIYKDLRKVLTIAIDKVSELDDKEKAFKNLASMFEAMLAYHKAYGGN